MFISIALALLATANGLSLKLKKRKIRMKRDFSAKSLIEEKTRLKRDTDMMADVMVNFFSLILHNRVSIIGSKSTGSKIYIF